MYADIPQFAVDKGLAAVVEEGIAPIYVRRFHELHGRKVMNVTKNLGDPAQSRKYDLIDSLGVKWECKNDRAAFSTGNVYVEKLTLETSEADYYLFLVGIGYVVPKSAIREEYSRATALVRDGDEAMAIGALISLERLEQISEQVIVL